MIRKNFILFFLVISLMLPIGFAFVKALSPKGVDNKSYASIPLSCPEEESKEDNKPFEKEKEEEKEKKLILLGLTLTPFVSTSEYNIYLQNHTKPINGNSLLPFNPPELI